MSMGMPASTLNLKMGLPAVSSKVGLGYADSLGNTSVAPVVKTTPYIYKPKAIVYNWQDTGSVRSMVLSSPYMFQRTEKDAINQSNFLITIPEKALSDPFEKKVFHETDTLVHRVSLHTSAAPTVVVPTRGISGNLKVDNTFNWIAVTLVVSLFVFAIVKMLYEKYILQIISAVVDYHVSVRIFRERNVLFRNMALGLNVVFACNVGLFLYFLTKHFGFNGFIPNYFLNILIFGLGVVMLYNLKAFFCRLIGIIFMVQDETSEYVFNFNLFNKCLGLFLFPSVMLFPFVPDSSKPFVLLFGILVFICLFLLRYIRGVQIIMRKDFSLYYLILYLCAVEILPVLILVKVSMSLI
jgi:hypothetical protein